MESRKPKERINMYLDRSRLELAQKKALERGVPISTAGNISELVRMIIDDFNRMKSCPYHNDWHYCCRCNFEYICKWSDNKIKEVQKKYIKENWGK